MQKRGIQIPFSFIIFLIIILIVVVLILIWNFSGLELFTNVFGTSGEIVENTSGGAVKTLI